MIGVTTAVMQDKRIKTKQGKYAIKLRITLNRDQKYFPLGKHLTIEEWQKLQEDNPRDKELKRLKLLFAETEKKAIKIIDEMETFSFEMFAKKFNNKPISTSDILDALKTKQGSLALQNKLSSAESYKSTINSFTKFIKTQNRKKLKYSDITPEWLENYEQWMLTEKNSISTTGIYIRNLRTILNQAIEAGNFSREFYPFGKSKYQIPAAKNIKKALTLGDIKMIVEYTTTTEAEKRAKDLWLFSYLCNGVNIKDIAKLQNKNLSTTHISFVRAKTATSTKTNQKPITVIRMPEIDAIIEKWGTKSKDPNSYIFEILNPEDTPSQELAKIKQAVKTINKYTKRIGKALKFSMPLTTYTARHSYATILKRSGTPIEFISESLGHKDLKTTENYLDSFEDDVKVNYQRKLLNF